MTYLPGNKILASDFNYFVNSINNIWGVGNGQIGYGQSSFLSTVNIGNKILASDWSSLRSRMLAIANHQGTSTDFFPSIGRFSSGQKITAHVDSVGENLVGAVNLLNSNSLNVDIGSVSLLSSVLTSTRTTSWGTNPSSTRLKHEFTVDFLSEDAARAFFNSGGQIRFRASRNNGTSNTTNTNWSTILSDMGTIIFNYESTTKTGSIGVGSNFGYYDLVDTYERIFTTESLIYSYIYTLNDYTIYAKRENYLGVNGGNGSRIRFEIQFNDDVIGTPDLVDGTLESFIDLRKATTYLTIPSPTLTNITLLSDSPVPPEVPIDPPIVPSTYPDPETSNFYSSSLYYIYGNGSGPYTFNVPSGFASTGDALLSIFLSDDDHSAPVINTPSGSQILSHITIADGGISGGGNNSGSTLAVARSIADSNTPSLNWSVPNNDGKSLLYVGILPSRFGNCNYQEIATDFYPVDGIPPDNANSINFTAPFDGYYFCIQGQDVAGGSGNNIPGSSVPYFDQSYGIGFLANTGIWSSPGPYVVPDSNFSSGGAVFRVDWAYLSAGTGVTVNYRKLTNTRAINYPSTNLLMTVIGFQTQQ